MQTRKDLYQAHRLMTQRLGLALLQAEPDLPESPMRRQNVATFAGILIAVLITAGFGIWGMLKPGNATKLKEAGQLLVEEETGASYIYDQRDGTLRPVANYTSARLLLDSQDVKVRTVSAESLAGFRRGQKLGIQGAPDSLPKPERLVKAPWSACVAEGAAGVGGVRKPYVTLIAGTDVGGRPVGGDALVVNDGQQSWVLWAGLRLRVTNVDRLTDQTPRRVPPSWINTIPAGADFAAPPVAARGRRVAGPGGTQARVGQVFTVPPAAGAAARWYVQYPDGLAAITHTQAMLLLQDPASKTAYGRQPVRELTIDAASANAVRQSASRIRGGGLPETMPRFRAPSVAEPLCAVYADTVKGSVKSSLTVGGTMRLSPPAVSGSPDKVDQVLLPAGTAVLAGQLPGEGKLASVQQFWLVTDQGRRFRLASPDLVGKLGYSAADIAPVPTQLLRLIPDGPALDPVAARTPMEDTRTIPQPATQ
ncbi:type VII secretion protein EccB [Nonomuraea sp. NN258]|uniref:type VII secretion protein EccB n=1 Tax=Nonomuraea antri TaxID=2730852 RepID=UPI001569CC56|nr:type VII secretion protein EccB [Nonomuraea antri]NRQ39074.1 type VII secretion protein EccB [Nonomuraea antri]